MWSDAEIFVMEGTLKENLERHKKIHTDLLKIFEDITLNDIVSPNKNLKIDLIDFSSNDTVNVDSELMKQLKEEDKGEKLMVF